MTQLNETASFVATMMLNSLLVGMLIAVGVYIALKLTRGASPRMRYLLVVISFLTAAALPFVIVLLPVGSAPLLTVIEHSSTENPQAVENYSSQLAPATFRPNSSEVESGLVVKVDSIARFLSHSSISIGLFSVWLIGASLLLGREVSGHFGAARARRTWRPASRDIRQRLSWPGNIPLFIDNRLGPCALGVIKPTVVMPSYIIDDLSTNASRQVARHELDHLKWRDPFMNSVMRVMRACLWPSLPLWYLEWAAVFEREAAADRSAIRTGSADLSPDMAALEYASTLLSIAKKRSEGNADRHHFLTATEAGREPGLEVRIRRLLAVSSRPRHAHLFLAVVTLLASAVAVILLPIAKVPTQANQTTSDAGRSIQVGNNPGFETGIVDEPLREALASTPAALSRVADTHRSDTNKEARMSRSAGAIDEESSVPIATIADAEEVPTPVASPAVNLDPFESRMAAVGYKDLSPRQLADMKAYAVGPAYVAEMVDSGYGGLSADMLIRFKWLAVNSAFIQEMKALGYDNLPPRTLADFRQYGVSSTYIREMRALVSGPISAEQLVSLRLYGASADFVRQLKGLGYERIGANQLIGMRLQGVTLAYIEEMRSRGIKELSLDNLIAMRMGINN